MQAGDLGLDIRCHTGALRDQPVARAGAGAARRSLTRRVLVAACGWVERVEAVAVGARGVVGDEGVLALPARSVGGVEGVEVDQSLERVGRRTVASRAEAV